MLRHASPPEARHDRHDLRLREDDPHRRSKEMELQDEDERRGRNVVRCSDWFEEDLDGNRTPFILDSVWVGSWRQNWNSSNTWVACVAGSLSVYSIGLELSLHQS